MGEEVVVMSSEESMEMELMLEEKEEEVEVKMKKDGTAEVVMWEKFLPQMVLRVLLVEADDSTRQIIAALLRKCSYKVSSFSDGLKAWETLKGKPNSIDLILTEVELPSISGMGLLTLAMEHDVCKNIPVIMMSSHDSIGVSFKCMLNGAADFLIKPVRRNELKNVWQHVWRRQTATGLQSCKVEATSENNAASNHSIDYVASTGKYKECSEKASDAQTSCMAAESAYVQNMQGTSQLKCKDASNSGDTNWKKREERIKFDKESSVPESETGEKSIKFGSEGAFCNITCNSTEFGKEEDHTSANMTSWDKGLGSESLREKTDANSEINRCNDEPAEPSSAVIDLIGSFENRMKCAYGQSTFTNHFSFSPNLELSLRSFRPTGLKNEGTDEGHILNHSNSSAFSLYNSSKALQPLFLTLAIESEEGASLNNSGEIMTTLVNGPSGQVEVASSSSLPGIIPVQGVSFDTSNAGYGHVFPPLVYTQPGSLSVCSPKPAGSTLQEKSPFSTNSSRHSTPETQNSQQGYSQFTESTSQFTESTKNSTDQNVHKLKNNLETGKQKHISPTTGQSNSSGLCNSVVVNNLNSSAYGSICNRSDGNATAASASGPRTTALESQNDAGLLDLDGFIGMDSHRSNQRESALAKFRLKRKERCFEKKVRYQSRKKLAEQRPRVKGQFVRQ